MADAQRLTERQIRLLTKKLAGDVALSPEERAAMESHEAANEASTQAGAEAGTRLLAEATGVPSILRGARDVKRGYDEGSLLRGAGGVGEIALGALPGGSLLRGGKAILGKVMPNVPAAIATTTGLGLPSAMANDAEAADLKRQQAISENPEVKRLREEVRKLEAQRLSTATTSIKGLSQASGDAARARADKAIADQLDGTDKAPGLRQQLAEAEKAAGEGYSQNAPFRERHPGMAPLLFGGGLALAGGMPFVKGVAKAVGDVRRGRAIDAATTEAKTAMGNLTAGTGTAEQAATAQDLLARRVAGWDRRHSLPETLTAGAGNAAKGAFVAAEGSSLPEQIDYNAFEPGHPTRERAAKLFASPSYYAERLAPAALGAGSALLGGTLGKGAGRAATLGYEPDLAKARQVVAMGEEPSAAQKLAARIMGGEAKGPSEQALAKVERYRGAVADNETLTLDALERQRQAQKASDELRRLEAESQRRSGGQTASPVSAEAAPTGGQSQQPVQPGSQSSTLPAPVSDTPSIQQGAPPVQLHDFAPGARDMIMAIADKLSGGLAGGGKRLPPVREAGPGRWAEEIAPTARDVMRGHLEGGGSIGAKAKAGQKLTDQINAALPGEVKPISAAEVRDRIAGTRGFVGDKPTPAEFDALMAQAPQSLLKGKKVFGVAPAIGATGYALSPDDARAAPAITTQDIARRLLAR